MSTTVYQTKSRRLEIQRRLLEMATDKLEKDFLRVVVLRNQ